MRKKRAQTAGTEANLAAVKLVPGRKKRERISKPRSKKYKSLQRNGSDHGPSVHMQDMEDGIEAFDAYAGLSLEPPSSPVQERAEDAEEDDDDDEGRDASGNETQDTKLPNKGGVTRPYKIKSTLEGIVDTKLISANGFDVLNLTMVANFMGLFNTTYADPADDSIATAISPATITLLHGILVDFITTAVHCVISLREEEIKLKRKIKAWRLTKEDEITAENVMDALQMHGFINRSLLSDALGPSEPSTLEAATVDNTDCIEQRFVEDETGLPTRLCLHREVRPPFVSLSSDGDQSLMAIDTDTEQLSAELDEESELDNADCQKEAEYEKKLWRASLRRAKNGQ
ncbi:hypothetical protein C8J57DRAFT_588782 [Mycena rebaudengoi]|nr:hypothetical protein C8J57DRAFT_588782 [Mycena rebaudengoi]